MGTLAIEPRSLESHERNVGLADQARLNALRRASEKHFVVAFLQNLSQCKSGVDVAGRSAARKNEFHREFLPLPRRLAPRSIPESWRRDAREPKEAFPSGRDEPREAFLDAPPRGAIRPPNGSP